MTGAGIEVKADFFFCTTPQSPLINLVKFRWIKVKVLKYRSLLRLGLLVTA